MDFCLKRIDFGSTFKRSNGFFMVIAMCKRYSFLVQHFGILRSNLKRDVICHYGFIIHSNAGKCPSLMEECRCITWLYVKQAIKCSNCFKIPAKVCQDKSFFKIYLDIVLIEFKGPVKGTDRCCKLFKISEGFSFLVKCVDEIAF